MRVVGPDDAPRAPEYPRVDSIEATDSGEEPQVGLAEAVSHQKAAALEAGLQPIQGIKELGLGSEEEYRAQASGMPSWSVQSRPPFSENLSLTLCRQHAPPHVTDLCLIVRRGEPALVHPVIHVCIDLFSSTHK